jgi:hypothetical protein
MPLPAPRAAASPERLGATLLLLMIPAAQQCG